MHLFTQKVLAQFNSLVPFDKPLVKKILNKLDLDTVSKDVNYIDSNKLVNDENLKIMGKSEYNTNTVFYPPLHSLTYNSLFGIRRHPIYHKMKLHAGVDLKARYEAVFAITNGVIIKVGYGQMEGNFVLISHNTIESIYCHLSKLSCVEGQNIKGGECIGISGNTGRSTGPHLHFGIKYKGAPINPLIYLKNIVRLNQ